MNEDNKRELLSSQLFKTKKKRCDEEIEIIKSRGEDENYIYLELETPEENQQAMKASGDKSWQPGTSGAGGVHKSKKTKTTGNVSKQKMKTKSSSGEPPPSTATVSASSTMAESSSSIEQSDSNRAKKYKKGLATPKQRLAKKLKMSM